MNINQDKERSNPKAITVQAMGILKKISPQAKEK